MHFHSPRTVLSRRTICGDVAVPYLSHPVPSHWIHGATKHLNCGQYDRETEFDIFINFKQSLWLMATQLDSEVLERGVSGDGAHSDVNVGAPTESLGPQHVQW